jgi:hypothetical protein
MMPIRIDTRSVVLPSPRAGRLESTRRMRQALLGVVRSWTPIALTMERMARPRASAAFHLSMFRIA